MSQPFISIIIPAHNEETRLGLSLQRILSFLNDQPYTYEILIVENGSQDRTLQLSLDYEKQNPNLRVIHLEASGKGFAIRNGIYETHGKYRFILDADLSMPIKEINKFVPPACDCQVCIASREASGAIRYNEPFIRHIAGRVYNLLVRLLLLPGLRDTQCGFKCFRGDVAEDIFRFQKFNGWSFDAEILYIARLHGWQIREIPIPWYYLSGSKINIVRDSIQMFFELLTIRLSAHKGMYNTKS